MNKRQIYDILVSQPNVVVGAPNQLRTKCFLCGDSKKNPNKKRLGIKIDINNPREPILYQCFNCFRKGVFTVDMLHEMNVYDKEVEIAIRELNHNALKDDGTRANKYRNTKEIDVEFPPLYKNDINLRKIKYLWDRLGYKVPPEQFNDLKLIFNLGEFLELNKIKPLNQHVKTMSEDYIGFLSVNNEYVICRDITGTHNMRYIKYNMFDVYDNTHAFYTIKNQINLLDTEPIHICPAEGPFDTLSLLYNVFNQDKKNKIMLSTCNGSMLDPIKYYLKKGLVGSNIIIDCYQDNDTRLNFRRMQKELSPYIVNKSNFHVFYNTLSKDFGVPKDNINIDELNI